MTTKTHKETVHCEAEITEYVGRWPVFRQCAKTSSIEMTCSEVPTFGEVGSDRLVKLCGTHRRVLESGGRVAVITGPKVNLGDLWGHNYFPTVSVKLKEIEP